MLQRKTGGIACSLHTHEKHKSTAQHNVMIILVLLWPPVAATPHASRNTVRSSTISAVPGSAYSPAFFVSSANVFATPLVST